MRLPAAQGGDQRPSPQNSSNGNGNGNAPGWNSAALSPLLWRFQYQQSPRLTRVRRPSPPPPPPPPTPTPQWQQPPPQQFQQQPPSRGPPQQVQQPRPPQQHFQEQRPPPQQSQQPTPTPRPPQQFEHPQPGPPLQFQQQRASQQSQQPPPTPRPPQQFEQQPPPRPSQQSQQPPPTPRPPQFEQQLPPRLPQQFERQPPPRPSQQSQQPPPRPSQQFERQPPPRPSQQFEQQPPPRPSQQCRQPPPRPSQQFERQPPPRPSQQFEQQPQPGPPLQFQQQRASQQSQHPPPTQRPPQQFEQQPPPRPSQQFEQQPPPRPSQQFEQQPPPRPSQQFEQQPPPRPPQQFEQQPPPQQPSTSNQSVIRTPVEDQRVVPSSGSNCDSSSTSGNNSCEIARQSGFTCCYTSRCKQPKTDVTNGSRGKGIRGRGRGRGGGVNGNDLQARSYIPILQGPAPDMSRHEIPRLELPSHQPMGFQHQSQQPMGLHQQPMGLQQQPIGLQQQPPQPIGLQQQQQPVMLQQQPQEPMGLLQEIQQLIGLQQQLQQPIGLQQQPQQLIGLQQQPQQPIGLQQQPRQPMELQLQQEEAIWVHRQQQRRGNHHQQPTGFQHQQQLQTPLQNGSITNGHGHQSSRSNGLTIPPSEQPFAEGRGERERFQNYEAQNRNQFGSSSSVPGPPHGPPYASASGPSCSHMARSQLQPGQAPPFHNSIPTLREPATTTSQAGVDPPRASTSQGSFRYSSAPRTGLPISFVQFHPSPPETITLSSDEDPSLSPPSPLPSQDDAAADHHVLENPQNSSLQILTLSEDELREREISRELNEGFIRPRGDRDDDEHLSEMELVIDESRCYHGGGPSRRGSTNDIDNHGAAAAAADGVNNNAAEDERNEIDDDCPHIVAIPGNSRSSSLRRVPEDFATNPTGAGAGAGAAGRGPDSQSGAIKMCRICNCVYITSAHYQEHFRIHTEDDLFRCRTCGENFNQLCSYQKHLGTAHTGEKLFLCAECGVGFRVQADLGLHIKNIHLQRPSFQCSSCPNKFQNEELLEAHVAANHRIIIKFPCTICGATFDSQQLLYKHLAEGAHSKSTRTPRPFKCLECPRTFGTREVLELHVAGQHRELKFVCPTCGEKFAHEMLLHTHSAVHTSSRGPSAAGHSLSKKPPFTCKFCPNLFPTKHMWERHLLFNSAADSQPWTCVFYPIKVGRKANSAEHVHLVVKPAGLQGHGHERPVQPEISCTTRKKGFREHVVSNILEHARVPAVPGITNGSTSNGVSPIVENGLNGMDKNCNSSVQEMPRIRSRKNCASRIIRGPPEFIANPAAATENVPSQILQVERNSAKNVEPSSSSSPAAAAEESPVDNFINFVTQFEPPPPTPPPPPPQQMLTNGAAGNHEKENCSGGSGSKPRAREELVAVEVGGQQAKPKPLGLNGIVQQNGYGNHSHVNGENSTLTQNSQLQLIPVPEPEFFSLRVVHHESSCTDASPCNKVKTFSTADAVIVDHTAPAAVTPASVPNPPQPTAADGFRWNRMDLMMDLGRYEHKITIGERILPPANENESSTDAAAAAAAPSPDHLTDPSVDESPPPSPSPVIEEGDNDNCEDETIESDPIPPVRTCIKREAKISEGDDDVVEFIDLEPEDSPPSTRRTRSTTTPEFSPPRAINDSEEDEDPISVLARTESAPITVTDVISIDVESAGVAGTGTGYDSGVSFGSDESRSPPQQQETTSNDCERSENSATATATAETPTTEANHSIIHRQTSQMELLDVTDAIKRLVEQPLPEVMATMEQCWLLVQYNPELPDDIAIAAKSTDVENMEVEPEAPTSSASPPPPTQPQEPEQPEENMEVEAPFSSVVSPPPPPQLQEHEKPESPEENMEVEAPFSSTTPPPPPQQVQEHEQPEENMGSVIPPPPQLQEHEQLAENMEYEAPTSSVTPPPPLPPQEPEQPIGTNMEADEAPTSSSAALLPPPQIPVHPNETNMAVIESPPPPPSLLPPQEPAPTVVSPRVPYTIPFLEPISSASESACSTPTPAPTPSSRPSIESIDLDDGNDSDSSITFVGIVPVSEETRRKLDKSRASRGTQPSTSNGEASSTRRRNFPPAAPAQGTVGKGRRERTVFHDEMNVKLYPLAQAIAELGETDRRERRSRLESIIEQMKSQ